MERVAEAGDAGRAGDGGLDARAALLGRLALRAPGLDVGEAAGEAGERRAAVRRGRPRRRRLRRREGRQGEEGKDEDGGGGVRCHGRGSTVWRR